jgi:hypothetical protein
MRAPKEGGSRIGIVFNGSPLFTGDAGSGESNIRQWIIENDWLEAVVALPDQLFYNTGISTYIWVLTNRKEQRRKGKVHLIDGRQFYVKMKKSLGNKRNKIGDPADELREPDQIADISRIHGNFGFLPAMSGTQKAGMITRWPDPTRAPTAASCPLTHWKALSATRSRGTATPTSKMIQSI